MYIYIADVYVMAASAVAVTAHRHRFHHSIAIQIRYIRERQFNDAPSLILYKYYMHVCMLRKSISLYIHIERIYIKKSSHDDDDDDVFNFFAPLGCTRILSSRLAIYITCE